MPEEGHLGRELEAADHVDVFDITGDPPDEDVTDALVEVFSQHDRVLPYIDMPLQHASDSMLRAMRRGHGGERMYKVIERLRGAIPDLVFRTTIGTPLDGITVTRRLQALLRAAGLRQRNPGSGGGL